MNSGNRSISWIVVCTLIFVVSTYLCTLIILAPPTFRSPYRGYPVLTIGDDDTVPFVIGVAAEGHRLIDTVAMEYFLEKTLNTGGDLVI